MKTSLATPQLLQAVTQVALQAAEQVMQVYRGAFAVRGKADASPVTEADERAEALITAALLGLQPEVPVVAEEAAARGEVPAIGGRFWLVDPLDGTREFVSRNGEFTVNIALVEDGEPVLGVLVVPVDGRVYAGLTTPGVRGAWRRVGSGEPQPIRVRGVPTAGPVLACSRSHGDETALQKWLARQGRAAAGRVVAGSSLKFGLLAEGAADWYPRFGRTMEWDTAAGHAVLAAAGGEVLDLQGRPLRYGKPGFENPHFWARGAPAGG